MPTSEEKKLLKQIEGEEKMRKNKKFFSMLVILFLFMQFFANISFAQTNTTTTIRPGCCGCLPTDPACDCLPGIPSCYSVPTSLKDIYNFFSSINPFILLIFGLIVLVVAKLAKYVAIALIIFALIQILLLLIR